MPATPLPVNTISRAGAAPVGETTATNVLGYQLATNNGVSTWVEITNTAAAALTVTVPFVRALDGVTVPAKSYSIPASSGAKFRIGPFPVELYGTNPTVLFSTITCSVAAYQI